MGRRFFYVTRYSFATLVPKKMGPIIKKLTITKTKPVNYELIVLSLQNA